MKQSKQMLFLEILCSSILLAGKYFLAIESICGWYATATGYGLYTVFNFKKSLKIISIITTGLFLLSSYGLYKWHSRLNGLETFDYIVITLTLIFGSVVAYFEWKSKKPGWLSQTIVNFLAMTAYTMIGLGIKSGWWFLAGTHVILPFVYGKRGAYVTVVMQIISLYVALTNVTSLQLPF